MKNGDYFFVLLLVVVTCGCVYLLLPAYADYDQARTTVRELEDKGLRQELEARQLREDIHALKSDPEAIERIAREKLGWCRDNEKIYHFDSTNSETGDE